MKNTLISITILFFLGCSETKKQENKTYKAGFKIIRAVDTSRIYKPGTATINYLHYRPLDIDVWYPATASLNDSALVFRDILGLLEKRANYYTASNAGNGLTQQIAHYLCTGFNCSDTGKLLNFKTKSYKDAIPVNGVFPLVIYLCAFNGMSYENFTLFEDLAKKGLVVVSISSIGRYPGDMSMKKEDLLQQVNDATVSLKILEQSLHIQFSKIGIVGYSWGGLAGAVLAGKIPNVKCLISLDGSEFHHYGESKEENEDFDDIKNSDGFKNMKLSTPYLRLESSPLPKNDKEDSIYNFSGKLSGEKLIYKIDSAQHEDFGCLASIVRESGNCTNKHYFNTISNLTVSFLSDHLKNENSFSKVAKEEATKIEKKE